MCLTAVNSEALMRGIMQAKSQLDALVLSFNGIKCGLETASYSITGYNERAHIESVLLELDRYSVYGERFRYATSAKCCGYDT